MKVDSSNEAGGRSEFVSRKPTKVGAPFLLDDTSPPYNFALNEHASIPNIFL